MEAARVQLTDEDRGELLRLARLSISGSAPVVTLAEMSESLQQPAGAFVTLRVRANEELRGCVGTFRTDMPLAEVVLEMAHASAHRDPRFTPIETGEVDSLSIEISVLAPPHAVGDISEIEIGTHGVRVRNGMHTGVLLPEVATRQKWNPEQFVEATCRKAGLPPDSWKTSDTVIEVFETVKFRD